jgi:hypothetical protein
MTFASSGGVAESAAGSGATYFYRLNSVYDPDATGVGASAIGYTTWAALYLNYKVHKVTVRVQGTVTGMSAGSFANVIIVLFLTRRLFPQTSKHGK